MRGGWRQPPTATTSSMTGWSGSSRARPGPISCSWRLLLAVCRPLPVQNAADIPTWAWPFSVLLGRGFVVVGGGLVFAGIRDPVPAFESSEGAGSRLWRDVLAAGNDRFSLSCCRKVSTRVRTVRNRPVLQPAQRRGAASERRSPSPPFGPRAHSLSMALGRGIRTSTARVRSMKSSIPGCDRSTMRWIRWEAWAGMEAHGPQT